MSYPADQFELPTMARLASNLEHKLNTQHSDFNMFATEFKKARLSLAESYLEHDPYNLDMIGMVAGVAFIGEISKFENADGTSGFSMSQSKRTPEDRKARAAEEAAQNADFKKRRLFASPFNPKFWFEYSRFVGNAGDPHSIFNGDKAMQNAIVYSDDPLHTVTNAISEKQIQYFRFTQFDSQTDTEKAYLSEWQTLWKKTNMAETLLCPYLRARTVRDQICPYFTTDGESCAPAPFETEPQSIELHEKAMRAPECSGILASTIEELWYEEVPFSEAVNVSE